MLVPAARSLSLSQMLSRLTYTGGGEDGRNQHRTHRGGGRPERTHGEDEDEQNEVMWGRTTSEKHTGGRGQTELKDGRNEHMGEEDGTNVGDEEGRNDHTGGGGRMERI